jgi:hypothetical protein
MSWPQFFNYDLFLTRPNWISAPIHGYDHSYELVKNIGLEYSGSRDLETAFRLRASYTGLSRAEIADVSNFFDDKRGRLRPFWIPSWQADIRVVTPFKFDEITIEIEDCEYPTFWLPNKIIGRFLFFEWPDWGYKLQKVMAADDTHITCGTMNRDCSAAELPFLMVSFLYFVRFDIDELEINYIQPGVGDMELTFKTVYMELDE